MPSSAALANVSEHIQFRRHCHESEDGSTCQTWCARCTSVFQVCRLSSTQNRRHYGLFPVRYARWRCHSLPKKWCATTRRHKHRAHAFMLPYSPMTHRVPRATPPRSFSRTGVPDRVRRPGSPRGRNTIPFLVSRTSRGAVPTLPPQVLLSTRSLTTRRSAWRCSRSTTGARTKGATA